MKKGEESQEDNASEIRDWQVRYKDQKKAEKP